MNLPYEYSREFRQAMCPIKERYLEGIHRGQPEQVRFEAAQRQVQDVAELHFMFLQFSTLTPADQVQRLWERVSEICEESSLVVGHRYRELLAQRHSLIRQLVGVRPDPATVTAEARSETMTTIGDRGEGGTTGVGQSLLGLMRSPESGTSALDRTQLWSSLPTSVAGGAGRVFRRDGQMWTLTFDGKTVHMRDAKGLFYICSLLRCPRQSIQAAELMAAAAGHAPGSIALGSAGSILDDTAISEYKRRLRALPSEIGDAERNNDVVRKAALVREQEQIELQLRSAVGLGGKRRTSSDDAERVRKAVSNAISRAITTIRKHHRPLADHLQRLIDRGQQLSYKGDGISWTC